jgi:hypothetical protein
MKVDRIVILFLSTITLVTILFVTFDTKLTVDNAYATLSFVRMNPNAITAYSDDKTVTTTIDVRSFQEVHVRTVCPPLSNCHTEVTLLDDTVNFQFVNDPTNLVPLEGTFNPAFDTYPSNSGTTSKLTIKTETLPVGTYKFQVKVLEDGIRQQLVDGIVTKVSTLNPEPNPSQTNQRLVNLEQDIQTIKNTLENPEAFRGPPGPEGPEGPQGPQGERGPQGELCPKAITKTFVIQGQGPTTLTVCTPT